MTTLLCRALRIVLVTFMAMLLAATTAAADAPFSFDSTPGRLPKTVVPIRYAIELTPDVANLTFTGIETIEIEVRAPTDTVVLNALDLAIASAGINGVAAAITFDRRAETATLTFPRPLAAGRHPLALSFSGRINSKTANRALYGRGLFAADYTDPRGSQKRMIATNLEPFEARRVFPGFDEPSFKAEFELHAVVPDKHLGVSNMPVAREQPADAGRKRVSFAPTPKMSSYLFVFASGELERSSIEADGVTISVIGPEGSSARAKYALDSSATLLRYFNDYFGVKYPLPKLDMIAVPGGIGIGMAMENWGGITYHERALLFDERTGREGQRREIFMVIAHEMAHQWFGNLVTLAWWDNLWLNESFASWMQYKATDQLNPSWQAWLSAAGYKQYAMKKDAGRASHPIQQPVTDERTAIAAFDEIAYGKGQALVRMAETYLGEEVFRDGIRRYMQAHGLSNATSADLWRALGAASGKEVGRIASPFIEQPGIPLIVADAECTGNGQRMKLRQERFTVQYPNAQPLRWPVPILFGPVRAGATPERAVLDGTAEVVTGACSDLAKLNLGDTGYYRVKYDPATLAALQKELRTLSPLDQANLVADIRALSEAGAVSIAANFDLVDQIGAEPGAAVTTEVIRTFERIDHLAGGRPGQEDFRTYARAALRPVFDRLGWTAQPGEGGDHAILRADLLRTLGAFGDEGIIAEAKQRFQTFLREPTSLTGDLRDAVVHLAGRHADRATYDTLIRLARESRSDADRIRYYTAAAAALDPALAQQTLSLAHSDELVPALVNDLIEGVAVEHRDLAWTFVRTNFASLSARQGEVFRDTFVANLMAGFTNRARADELASFTPVQETAAGRILAERARQSILADSALAEREFPVVAAWVRRRNDRR